MQISATWVVHEISNVCEQHLHFTQKNKAFQDPKHIQFLVFSLHNVINLVASISNHLYTI